MLILIAGATGNLGGHLVRSALAQGHQVRGLGRSPNKLSEDVRTQLESFVQTSGFDDIKNLDIGCTGVDAVVCAYSGEPQLLLDGQLALLRAAERAGVRRFHAASWNLDWSSMPLGAIESYDPMISFSRHVALTSSIKPTYVFTGVLATVLFNVPGAGALEGDSAVWNRKNDKDRVLNIIGDGETVTPYTTEANAAEFSIAIVTSDNAERGGYYRFCSDEFTLKDLAAMYSRIRHAECSINSVMDIETCKQTIQDARRSANGAGELHSRWKSHVGLIYGLFFAEGHYNPRLADAEKYPEIKRTKIEDYIRENGWI